MGLQSIFALLAGGVAVNAFQQIQQSLIQLNNTLNVISQNLQRLATNLQRSGQVARQQAAGINAATQSTRQLTTASLVLSNVISGGLSQAFQIALQAAQQFYQRSIVSNQQLEKQITSSAIAFAQSVRLFDQFGNQITDTAEEINVLRGEFRELILDLDKATRGIPGATDQRTRAVLQNIILQSNQIVGQEKGFKSLTEGIREVTVALTTASAAFDLDESIQIPQEIRALLTGDVNNPGAQLARQLGITRQELEKARGEGRLLAFILEKSQTLIAGNNIQAKTLNNSFSNITNVADEFFRKLGEAAFPSFENAFAEFAQFLSDNEDSLTNFAVEAGRQIGEVLQEVIKFGRALGQAFVNNRQAIDEIVVPLRQLLVPALKITLRILTDIVKVLGRVSKAYQDTVKAVNLFRLGTRQTAEDLEKSAKAAERTKNALDATAESASKAGNAIEESTDKGDFTILGNEVLELGSGLDQVRERVDNTFNQLETVSNQVQRDSFAKQLTQDLSTLAKSGGADLDRIVDGLTQLATSTTLSPEGTFAAQAALVQVLKQQETQLNEIINLEKQRAELARFTPGITTAQAGIQQIDAEITAAEARLQRARAGLEALEASRPDQNFSAIRSAIRGGVTDVAALQAQFQGLDSSIISSILQVEKLELALEKSLADRATKIFKAVNDELSQIQQQAEAEIEGATISRRVELQTALNESLVREEEVAVKRVQLEQETTNAQLELAKGRLAELEKLELSADPAERARQALEIEKARNEVGKLTLQTLEQELQIEQQIRSIALRNIQEEEALRQKAVQTSQTLAQNEISRFQFANRSLERQLALTSAQNELIQARQDLQTANAERQVSDIERAIALNKELANPRLGRDRRQDAEEELRQLGLQGVKEEELQNRRRAATREQRRLQESIAKEQQEAARKALEADIKRNQLALQRQKIEAQIAVEQAKAARASLQAERARTIATVRDPEQLSQQLSAIDQQIKAQEQVIGLREKELDLTNQQIEDEKTLADTRRQTLATQQEAQRSRQGGRRTSRIVNQSALAPGQNEQIVGEQRASESRQPSTADIQKANEAAGREVAKIVPQSILPEEVRKLFNQQFSNLSDLSKATETEGVQTALQDAANELKKVSSTITQAQGTTNTTNDSSSQQTINVTNNFPAFNNERFNLRLNGN